MMNQGLSTGAPNTDSFQTVPMKTKSIRRGDQNFFSQRKLGQSQGVRQTEVDEKRNFMRQKHADKAK